MWKAHVLSLDAAGELVVQVGAGMGGEHAILRGPEQLFRGRVDIGTRRIPAALIHGIPGQKVRNQQHKWAEMSQSCQKERESVREREREREDVHVVGEAVAVCGVVGH